MIVNKLVTDQAILGELGDRLAKRRLDRNWTQAEFAKQAGVSKRTIERLEAGESLQLSSLIRVCRALDLVDRFDLLIPPPVPSPIAQLKLRGKERRRASSTPSSLLKKKWTWGDKT